MYKVVSKVDNKFYSAFADNNAKIEYKIGELTFPVIDNTKIFVFKNFIQAKNYVAIARRSHFCIFKCDVINPTTTKNKNYINPHFFRKDFYSDIDFETIKVISEYRDNFPPPIGSVFVEAIELTELVMDENGTILPTVDELYNLFIQNNWKGLIGPAGCYRAIPALLKFNNKLSLDDPYYITNNLFQNFVNNSKLDAITLIYQGFDYAYYNFIDIKKYQTEPLYRLGRDLYLKLKENDLLFKN
jgi:hypothetical protein